MIYSRMTTLSNNRGMEQEYWGFSEQSQRTISKIEEEGEDLGWCTGFRESTDSLEVDEEEDLGWIARSGLTWAPMNTSKTATKSVYIRVSSSVNVEGRRTPVYHHHWYVIPQPGAVVLAPAFSAMPLETPHRATAVALLPHIYILGGIHLNGWKNPISDVVYSYDVRAPERGWERRLNMLRPRMSPLAVALNGKIYVFGGLKKGKISPYGEVYDPNFNRWDPLSAGAAGMEVSPFVSPLNAMFVDRCNKQHLLLHNSNDGTFTYDVSTDSFTFQKQTFVGVQVYGAAVVDGILYYCKGDNVIFGYDLVSGYWFPEPVGGLSQFINEDSENVSLVEVGSGRLCILWDKGGGVLSCLVVQVNRMTSPDGEELDACVESFRSYIVPGDHVEDFLVF